MSKRNIIVHYHIFKNAGSSIDRVLQASFGDAWVNYDRSEADAKISPAELESYILDHPGLQAISSHHAVPPLPNRHLNVYPIILIRHPVDRAYSAYLFEWKKQKGQKEPVGSFAEYIAEKFKHPRKNAVEDFQTIHLANRSYTHRMPAAALGDEGLLANARNQLLSVGYFGIVDRFSESLKHFSHKLGSVFPQIKWTEYQENRLQDTQLTIGDKVRSIASELDVPTYTQLVMRNQLDIRLYEYALGQFDLMNHNELK